VYELKKGKEAVNWCVHVEWTCRDQLRRINAEKDAIKSGITLVLDVSDDDPDEDCAVATECTERAVSGVLHSLTGAHQISSGILFQLPDSHVMAIGEW
jgi:hypothetical protein